MKFAYADPPYVGQAKKHYGAGAREVNHRVLIGTLTANYDGWALSCSSPSLRELLPLCPPRTRVMAWVKPYAVFKPFVSVAYGWEPVLVWGGRKEKERPKSRGAQRPFDWVQARPSMGAKVVGRKPDAFCFWLFEVLGLLAGDELEDVFPGSGAVALALERWQRQLPMAG